MIGFRIKILIAVAIIGSLIIGFRLSLSIKPPECRSECRSAGCQDILNRKREKISDNFYRWGNSWLKRSETGLWELYVEGNPFERGLAIGNLTADLHETQEFVFLSQLKEFVPSAFRRWLLKYFVLWFTRNIDEYITDESKCEIYGTSVAGPDDKYAFIAPRYRRLLNYHAAHDIANFLKDRNLAGCSSFALWGTRSSDKSLIVGRNFDFYGGEHFDDNKIVYFYNPAKGFKFVSISWAGMTGVLSGMNEKGISVTINAAKGRMPKKIGTPITLVVREILQYAANIKDAVRIAQKRQTFVSQSILVASAPDKKAVVLEKSPTNLFVREGEGDYIICTNHFLGSIFQDESKSGERRPLSKLQSGSQYRYERVFELIREHPIFDARMCATILRDQKGPKGKNIGMGNPKTINQLVGHHSVILKPSQQLLWVSVGPYKLGKYVAYDLKKIFALQEVTGNQEIYDKSLTIGEDDFLVNGGYARYLLYKSLRKKVSDYVSGKNTDKPGASVIDRLIESNPEYYDVYSLAGDYCMKTRDSLKAKEYYAQALLKGIPTVNEKREIENKLGKIR